jgi:shikimate dehydrogenase
MKKYLVIGNPIEHSLSPKIHNYWIKKHNIDAIYEKQKLELFELENLIHQVREEKINGVNVTIPYKQKIIPLLDKLSPEAASTQSVNTIYLKKNQVTGHNTDIEGFELSIKNANINFINKEVLVLGAGGVTSSIIYALIKMNVSKITVTNRTKNKAENLKKLFKNLTIIDWGDSSNFDIIINTTSVGLDKKDELPINLTKEKKNKFFFDVIYNPNETNFLKKGNELGNKTENGKNMFIYQASAAFNIWHNIQPEINNDVIKLLE